MSLPDGFPPLVLTAEAGTVERCPVLTRTRAFIADQGLTATLSHTVRNRLTGQPTDLTAYVDGSVVLRLREVAINPGSEDVSESTGDFDVAPSGTIYAPLTADMVSKPGLYQLSFGVKDAQGSLVSISPALLSVEASLFGDNSSTSALGPPTLTEIRMAVRDNAPSENLLLRELEFGTDQIIAAVIRPLRYWNEQPPPLDPFDTRNFPFREMWLRAIVACLYETAAAGYRRSHLPYSAGGVSVDDQAKEKDYITAAQLLHEEWRQFVIERKIAINYALFCGVVGSPYAL